MKMLFKSTLTITCFLVCGVFCLDFICAQEKANILVKTGKSYLPINGVKVIEVLKDAQENVKQLKPGDTITRYGANEIDYYEKMINLKDNIKEETIKLFFVRDGEEYIIDVKPGYIGLIAEDYFDAYRAYSTMEGDGRKWNKFVDEGLKDWWRAVKTDLNFNEAVSNLNKAVKLGCDNTIVLSIKGFCEGMTQGISADQVIDLYNKCLQREDLNVFLKNTCYLGLSNLYYEKGDIGVAKKYAEMSQVYIWLKNEFKWRAKDYREFLNTALPEKKIDMNKYILKFYDNYSDNKSGFGEKYYIDGKWMKNVEAEKYRIESYDNDAYNDFILEVTVESFIPSTGDIDFTPSFGLIFTDSGPYWSSNCWAGIYLQDVSVCEIKNDEWGKAIFSRAINKNAPNILKVAKKGNIMQCYINDKWINTVNLKRVYGKSIPGIQIIGSEVSLDDFKVYIKKRL